MSKKAEKLRDMVPFKGTSGKWKNADYDIRSEFEEFICRMPVGVLEETSESNTNAKAIAAVPQMHKLLNEFISEGIKDRPDQERVFDITARAQMLLIEINK